MGRRPKPSAVLEQTGAYRINPQRRRTQEPQAKGRPRLPSHLDEMGKRHWKRLVKLMEDMGTLSASDGPSLEQCASIYSEWRKAKDICDKIGMAHIIKDADGKPVSTKRNAYMSVKKQCEDRLFKYYVEFGMTASSRSTLKAQEKETGENWFEKALRQRTLDN